MKLLGLVFRNIFKHPFRAVLTTIAVAVAVFLIVILRSVVTSLEDAVSAAATNRIVTQSAVSLFVNLPKSYKERIAQIDGVDSVARLSWFGGYFEDPSNFFAQFAVDPETYFGQYPEIDLSDEQRRAFYDDKRGCIIGAELAKDLEKKGISLGSTIPLVGTIYPKEKNWEFTVRGIYRSKKKAYDEKTLFFHSDYLEEGRKSADSVDPSSVGVYNVKVKDGYRPDDVIDAIDALFAGGPMKTRTMTESAFSLGFVTMQGALPKFMFMIGVAVFFAILMTLINTMLIASRERLRDVGILKALGFTSLTIAATFVVESFVIALIGGSMGLGGAYGLVDFLRSSAGGAIFANLQIRETTTYFAAGAILLLTAAAALVPSLNAWRLKAVDALRMEI